jgi:hypothetical protein
VDRQQDSFVVVLTDVSTAFMVTDKEMLVTNLSKLIGNGTDNNKSLSRINIVVAKSYPLSDQNRSTSSNVLDTNLEYLPYLAPELVSRLLDVTFFTLGVKKVSPEDWRKVDIYTIGILFYELLTESRAWANISDSQIEESVRLGKRPEIPSTLINGDKVTKSLIDLMEKCWVGEPSLRIGINEVEQELFPLESDKRNP